VVEKAGCAGQADTLACLRKAPYTTLLNAANSVPGILSYSTVNLSYMPRPDGTALTDSPDVLIAAGKYAKVPFIVGSQEDEGTLFGLFTPNLTTTADVATYINTVLFPTVPRSTITGLVSTYQNTLEDGSPFRTGLLNNIYPQFKRVSALLGDMSFTLTRRIFLETAASVAPDVPSWSYLASYDHGTPILGTFHASDLLQVFYGVLPNNAARSIRRYYFSFIHNLDPNKGSGLPEWPRWSKGRQLMGFGANRNELVADTFRADSFEFVKANVGVLRV
jgi:carboxylesterase type B